MMTKEQLEKLRRVSDDARRCNEAIGRGEKVPPETVQTIAAACVLAVVRDLPAVLDSLDEMERERDAALFAPGIRAGSTIDLDPMNAHALLDRAGIPRERNGHVMHLFDRVGAMLAERDEWKARAEKAEAERAALIGATDLSGTIKALRAAGVESYAVAADDILDIRRSGGSRL